MWTSLINLALGMWLIFAPEIFHFGGASYINSRIAGPIIVLVSALAIRSVTRPACYLAILPALWLLATPIAFRYTQVAPSVDNIVIGLAVIGLALIPTTRRAEIGGGWRTLFSRSVALAEAKRHGDKSAPQTLSSTPSARVIHASSTSTNGSEVARVGISVVVMAALTAAAALLSRSARPGKPARS